MKLLKLEPAVIAGLVSAVLALFIAFGVDLSQEQVGTIMAVVSAVLALVVRQAVTPNEKVVLSTDDHPEP